MADPVIEQTSTTTTKASTEASAAAVLSPPVSAAADDYIRKAIAVGVLVQFTIYIAAVTWLMIVYGKDLSSTANNIIVIILTAEVGYMAQVFSYYMGSSSGSTAKSTALEKK